MGEVCTVALWCFFIMSMGAMATYSEGLHLLGFTYRLPRKLCLALLSMVSLHCAVDNTLMLRVVPADSAFSMDCGPAVSPKKLQRVAPLTAR